MHLKHLIAGVGLAALTANAHADYIAELGLGLQSGTGEITSDWYSDVDVDSSSSVLYANIYFGRVGTGSVPYREAAFLSRRSSLSLAKSREETEYESNDILNGREKVEVDTTALAARFVIPGPGIILGAGWQKAEIDSNLEGELRSITGGIYVNQRGALTLTYGVGEWDDKDDPSATDEDEKLIELAYRQVNSTGSRSHLAFYMSLNRYDDGYDYDDTTLGGGATWYPSQKFGVGARLFFTIGSDDEFDYFGARFVPHISFDFSEQVGLYAELESSATTAEVDGDDAQETEFVTLTAGVNVRF